MYDPHERITFSISTAELERRWQLTREVMRERRVDYLIARGDEEFLGGYVRWFTDVPARDSYPYTVIFPREEEMTLVSVGPFAPGAPAPPTWAVRGVKTRLSAPYFPSAHYTHTYDAELVTSVLKNHQNAVIGLIGKSLFPVNFCEYLVKHLPQARFIDLTDPIDALKAIKSEEEIALIHRVAALQDEVMAEVRRFIRPGLQDRDIFALVTAESLKRGSERQLILGGSAPPGIPATFQSLHYQKRVIREGDQFSLLIEVNGPGGAYAELARMFSLGPPSQEFVDAAATAAEAQRHTLALMKPGARPAEILAANSSFLEKRGYLPERRLYAHGQGYDLVERPLFLKDETMTLQTGMNITVHPAAATDRVWATVCDNYLIGPDGPESCLHRTPKEIIVIS
jgi:Xaa-Pro aminopeptidase